MKLEVPNFVKSKKKDKILAGMSEQLDADLAQASEIFTSLNYQNFVSSFVTDLAESLKKLISYAESEDEPVKFMINVKTVLYKIKCIQGTIDEIARIHTRKLKKEKDKVAHVRNF